MTPQQADKAIRNRQPVVVQDAFGYTFSITLTKRDSRTVSGVYVDRDGKDQDGKFYRADLRLVR